MNQGCGAASTATQLVRTRGFHRAAALNQGGALIPYFVCWCAVALSVPCPPEERCFKSTSCMQAWERSPCVYDARAASVSQQQGLAALALQVCPSFPQILSAAPVQMWASAGGLC